MSSVIFRKTLLQRCYPLFRFSARKIQSLSDEPNWETLGKKKAHTPVLLKEVIENLNLKEGNLFLDMTFGAGGHTEALLERVPGLQAFGLDRDPTAIEFLMELQKKFPGQILPLEGKFSDLPDLLENYEVKPNTFDGILFDLGCSSMQLDTAERGFSIMRDGPLDMRMDGGKAGGLTAADVITYATEKDLIAIFKTYGGEKHAVKIAQGLIQARARFKPLKTTQQLSDLVETVCEGQVRYDKLQRRTQVATKVFKALRAFVNNEINELHYGILLAHVFLKPGGRAAVISFDSSEDQIAKRQFQNRLVDNADKPLPLIYFNSTKDYNKNELKDFQSIKWSVVNKKVIVPSDEEVLTNARSRSAKLRVAIKLDST